jgi:glycerol kinase
MTTVLAIDQGTSGTKAMVIDADGRSRGLAERPLQPSYLPDGGVEQDPILVLNSVLDAGRAASAEAGIPIEIVTIANQGESVLAWDPATGRPLSPIIVWQDRRAAAICVRLAAEKDRLASRTGLVLDPYFTAPKMAWLRETLTRDGVLTTTDAWLLHHLTGAFVTDAATASRSLLIDLEAADWSAELLGVFGLQGERMPKILACDAIAGTTTAFGGEIPVGGLIVDQQAALLAEHCFAPGDAKCTFGTGAFLLANSGAGALRSRAGLAASLAWEIRGERRYCFDGQIYTAGSAIRWLRQLGFIADAADLDRAAAASSNGVICVPALAGLAAPWWNPDARASFSGLGLSTGPGELVRAVLEGLAAQVAALCALVEQETGILLRRLKVDGGLTHSTALMQALADIAQIEVEVFPSQHATVLGAVALARLAANPALTLADAVIQWSPERAYSPRWSRDQAGTFRGKWNRAAEKVASF